MWDALETPEAVAGTYQEESDESGVVSWVEGRQMRDGEGTFLAAEATDDCG